MYLLSTIMPELDILFSLEKIFTVFKNKQLITWKLLSDTKEKLFISCDDDAHKYLKDHDLKACTWNIWSFSWDNWLRSVEQSGESMTQEWNLIIPCPIHKKWGPVIGAN